MGQLTRDTLISEALLIAGDDSLSTRAVVWLNAWLRSQYRAWPWPFLHKRVSGLALNAGVQSLTLGNGSGGVALEIQRILDPIFVYDSSYSTRHRARIVNVHTHDLGADETVNNPASYRGLPGQFKVRAASTWGQWIIYPTPIPDKAYLLAVDYLEQPADLSGGSLIPVYPNDRTLIQSIVASAYQFMDDERYGDALQILGAMTIDDRGKYGEVAGTNDQLGLDPGVFR